MQRLPPSPGVIGPEGHLIAIIESADDAIVSKDLNGVIKSWNPAAERMFGWTAAEAIGRHITLIIPEERRAEEDHIIGCIRRGERVEHFETERLTRDGGLLNVSITVSPVKDASGRIVGASKIARDFTERRRLEDERDRLLVSAQAASRAKDQLLATVSHELRTPLNSILGYARLLEDPALDEATRAHAVEIITRSARSQGQLIDDLLDLSRVVTGRMRLTFTQADLTALVEAALDTVRPAATAKSLTLATAIAPERVEISCAPDRIRQVIWNLVTNAIKFTPAGGRIDVIVERSRDEAEVTVTDTGIGIAPETLPHVFELFSQEDPSSTRTHGGLGLGLALVKSLVELHGGQVTAHSPGKGKGATFTVRLPIPGAGPHHASTP